MLKIALGLFLISINSFGVSDRCLEATVRYEGAVEVYGANAVVANMGWRAYEVCKLDLNSSDQAVVEDLSERCLEEHSEEGLMNRALEAGCALRSVEYFLYSKPQK